MRIIRQSELVETPWKNGGGITRDIATETHAGTLLWRLSMADVSIDGPFSNFVGLTRVLTVIRGEGLILRGPDGDFRADHAVPVVFDGGAPIVAELTKGPLRDFNLMYDTARCDADADVVRGPSEIISDNRDQTSVYHCIEGQPKLNGTDRLAVGDTAIASGAPMRMALDQGDIVLRIGLRIRP